MKKIIISFKTILVLSLICGFALTATAQDYYPTEIGNTWVFRTSDGTEERTYSIEEPETDEDEGIVILRIRTETLGTDTVDNDLYFISDDAGDLKLHRARTEEGATFGVAEPILDPPALFFPASLPVGRTWDIVTVAELNLVGEATTTSTIEVVAIEDVETPIGTIENCVKLEIRRKSVTALVAIRTTAIQWLGPDIGPVKYEDVDQGIVYELQSYNLVETPAEVPETPEEPSVETPEEPTVETPEEPTVETPEEPTVETPEEPAIETPEEPAESSFNIALESGLNMISIPLMPAEPYTAKSLAEKLSATVVIKIRYRKTSIRRLFSS